MKMYSISLILNLHEMQFLTFKKSDEQVELCFSVDDVLRIK